MGAGCTNVGRTQKMVMIGNVSESGFHVFPKEEPPPEFTALVHAHSDRLRALLDRPALLAVHWDEGDKEAEVVIMSADPNRDREKPFEAFMLPFPELAGKLQ